MADDNPRPYLAAELDDLFAVYLADDPITTTEMHRLFATARLAAHGDVLAAMDQVRATLTSAALVVGEHYRALRAEGLGDKAAGRIVANLHHHAFVVDKAGEG